MIPWTIAFWVVVGALAAAAAGLILARAGKAAQTDGAADRSDGLYRRQIAEIDDLADRGLIPASERKSAHAEASRRLLAASERAEPAWEGGEIGRKAVLSAAMLTPALALALYFVVGASGYMDQPFAARLEAWKKTPPEQLAPAQLAAVLNGMVRERPNDPEALRFLAVVEGAAQNPAGAIRALRKAVKLSPERADLWEMLGEVLLFQSSGDVTDEAADTFREALKRNPASPIAQFHLARGKAQAGDAAGAKAGFAALLASLPAADPRRAAIQAEMDGAVPTSAVSEDQMVAIQGMVAGLAARLETQPRDPAGWVQLVRAYAVLGDQAKRDEALRRGRALFPGQADVLADLDAAAKSEPMR